MNYQEPDDLIETIAFSIDEWLDEHLSFEAWKSIRNDIIMLTEARLTKTYDETERRLFQIDLVGVLRAEMLAGAYAISKWHLRQAEPSDLREAAFSAANIVLGSCAWGWDPVTFHGYITKTRGTGESYVELASMLDSGMSWLEILDGVGVDWRSGTEDKVYIMYPTLEILTSIVIPRLFYEAISDFHDKSEDEVEEFTNQAFEHFLDAFTELSERLDYIVEETFE